MNLSPPRPAKLAEAAKYDPAITLGRLRSMSKQETPSARPSELTPNQIELYPSLFSSRVGELDDRHLDDLVSMIKNGRPLDPILVCNIGSKIVCVDGHYRLKAYRRANWSKPIPFTFFDGTLEEAVLEAGRRNSIRFLVMSNADRQNYAWKLTLIEEFTKPQIAASSGISESQVGNMRRTMKELGMEAFNYEEWWVAKKMANRKKGGEVDQDEMDAQMNAVADDLAARIEKVVGSKLRLNVDLSHRVLERYYGKHLERVAAELAYLINSDVLETILNEKWEDEGIQAQQDY